MNEEILKDKTFKSIINYFIDNRITLKQKELFIEIVERIVKLEKEVEELKCRCTCP